MTPIVPTIPHDVENAAGWLLGMRGALVNGVSSGFGLGGFLRLLVSKDRTQVAHGL